MRTLRDPREDFLQMETMSNLPDIAGNSTTAQPLRDAARHVHCAFAGRDID